MENLKKYYIYRIPQINYIGSTSNIKRRKAQHKLKRKIKCDLNILCAVFVGDKVRRVIEQKYINIYDSINQGANKLKSYITTEEKIKQKKIYVEKNKKKIVAMFRKYYLKNKHKILENKRAYWREKINCNNCGLEMCRDSIYKHKKTFRCKNYVAV